MKTYLVHLATGKKLRIQADAHELIVGWVRFSTDGQAHSFFSTSQIIGFEIQ